MKLIQAVFESLAVVQAGLVLFTVQHKLALNT